MNLRKVVLECVERILEAAECEYSSHHKGMHWQGQFLTLAEERGITVVRVAQSEGRHDWWANWWKVQCKWIDEVRGGYVAIDNMRPVKANGNERGYREGEYDVLALKHRGDVFLIPACALKDTKRSGFLRSRILIREFSRFIDKWAVFDGEPPSPPEQKRLYW